MEEQKKLYNRKIQKKYYYVNNEKIKQYKQIQYYYKFFDKNEINNYLDNNGFFKTIIYLKIERLKQRQNKLLKMKDESSELTYNFNLKNAIK